MGWKQQKRLGQCFAGPQSWSTLSLWSVFRCGSMFREGNSTFLMFSNLKNKMPNMSFFPPFFPPASSCQNRLFNCILCSQEELCIAIPSTVGEESCGVGLSLLEGIFYSFSLCVRDLKCSGNIQIVPAKNGCFRSSPFANFKLVKK